MDRILKVYTKTDHLFAEFTFTYDHPGRAGGRYIQYRRLYNDDEEDDNKTVFPLMEMDIHLQFIQFDAISKIKAYDIDIVKKELGREMTDPPASYKYVYDPQPVLMRYIAANHRETIGMINILYSFIDNTKEVKFLSGTNPRFDYDLAANSLETNISCILRIPVYTDRDITAISSYDLKRLPPWY
jgi:hypothetical protein